MNLLVKHIGFPSFLAGYPVFSLIENGQVLVKDI
jgi:hypothetical protein